MANGVTLTAFAVTPGCGTVTYEYPFEMNPMPKFDWEHNAFIACEGEHAFMDISLEGSTPNGNPTGPDFVVVINGVEYELNANDTIIDLGIPELGTTVYNVTSISNRTCQVTYEEGDWAFVVLCVAKPTLSLGEVPESVCEGEEVNIDMYATGGVGAMDFTVEGEGIESINFNFYDYYTLSLTPTEDVNIVLTKITDDNGCETTLELPINIVVHPYAAQPEINGDNDLDVRLTPNSP